MNEREPIETSLDRPEAETRTAPRFYVASLSDYVAGRLHGAWIEATGDAGTMDSEIAEMLAASSEAHAEEWAIHDYEGFGTLRLGEYESLETIAKLAQGIDEHGPAYIGWAQLVGLDWAEPERFEDDFLWSWDSLEAFANEMVADLGIMQELERLVPTSLRAYIRFDTAAYAHDLELGGEVSVVEQPTGGVWIFRS